jgi:hypothetical protein
VAVAEAKALPKLDPVPKDQERTRVLSRVKKLEDGFNSQKPTLQEISEYVLPYRGQWQGSQGQEQRGKRKGLKIINNTAGRSMSILSSGMMAGLTSPGRPWFKLSTQDPDLSEYTPVRSWLDDVARSMRTVFARSNLYNVLPGVYTELGGFGTSSLQEVDDPMSIVRFYPYTIGTYALAQDDRLVVDTFCRRYTSTVRQVVAKFGAGGRVSERVLQQYACGKFEESVEVIHIIQPNYRRQLGVAGWPGAPFLEEYWEANSNVVGYPLQRTGISERALFAPRWDVTGNDVWGTGLCHQIIGDVKQLQFLERRKEDVLEKHTAPPLEAGTELRGKRISLLAGDVNYTNPSSTGGAQIKPIVLTHPNAYQYVAEDIGTIERRIRSACYEDLFLMLANDTRSGITAREVEERHQEKGAARPDHRPHLRHHAAALAAGVARDPGRESAVASASGQHRHWRPPGRIHVDPGAGGEGDQHPRARGLRPVRRRTGWAEPRRHGQGRPRSDGRRIRGRAGCAGAHHPQRRRRQGPARGEGAAGSGAADGVDGARRQGLRAGAQFRRDGRPAGGQRAGEHG